MLWLLKRWWFWGGLLVLMVTLSISAVLVHDGRGATCRAKFDRITDSMGAEESLQILCELGQPSDFGILGPNCLVLIWADRTGQVAFTYEPEGGKVISKEFRPRSAWGQVRWLAEQWLGKGPLRPSYY